MADVERAVQIAFNQGGGDPKLVAEAERYLTQLQQSDEGWVTSISALQRSIQDQGSVSDQLLFWSLSTLVQTVPKRFSHISDGDAANFQNLLFQWLETCLPSGSVRLVRNKFAQLLVVTFERQWPRKWPDFWPKLFALLPKSEHAIEFFLRVLDTIDERVVDQNFAGCSPEERQKCTLIKDNMREQCIVDVVSTWYNILGAYHKTRPDIAQDCLQSLQNYIEWIDINLVTTQNYVNLFFFLFTQEELREDACDCIFELVSKRMEDPTPKLKLLESLNVCKVLPEVIGPLIAEMERLAPGDDYDSEQYALKVARLTQTVGMELLSVVEKAQALSNQTQLSQEGRQLAASLVKEAIQNFNFILPSLFSLFGAPVISVSSAMLDCIIQYIARLKRESSVSEEQKAQVLQLFNIIIRRVQYTELYKFSAPTGDYETEVTEHRKSLFVNFKNLCRCNTEFGSQFVLNQMVDMISNMHSAPWCRIEAVSALFYQFGEGMKGEVFNDRSSVFFQCMDMFINSNISMHPHPAVIIMFFEICDRYSQYFMVCQDKLPGVLAAFLDQRGIRSKDEIVAFRAAYLYKCLTTSLKGVVVNYIDQIYTAIKAILETCKCDESADTTPGLGIEEQLSLYETLGSLLGSQMIPYNKVMGFLDSLATPILKSMEQAVTSGALSSKEATSAACVVSNQISFLAYITKGFTTTEVPVQPAVAGTKAERRDMSEVFVRILQAILTTCSVGKHHTNIRDKTILFVHRMIDLMGVSVLEYIPDLMTALLEASNIAEAPKAIRLPMQIAKRVKGKAIPCIEKMFMPMVTRVFELTQVDALKHHDNVLSEEVRQHADLLRSYYFMLNSMLSTGCGQVLICDLNRPHLDKILQTIVQGCTTHPELDVAKVCFVIFNEMVKEWHSMDQFRDYIFDTIIPVSFQAPLRPHFDPKDAKANAILVEVGNLHKQCLNIYTTTFLARMEGFVGTIIPDKAACMQFLTQLQNADNKAYKNCLKELVYYCRKNST